MISGQIFIDDIVQENEACRIDASNSLVVGETLTAIDIEPEVGAGYISITTLSDKREWFLDWAYATAGTKTISLRFTNSLAAQTVFTKTVEVVSVTDDKLFSKDQDLIAFENDIMKWLPRGRGSWNFIHRQVQSMILNDIYKHQIVATDGTKLTKDQVLDVEEVKYWSLFWALELIFGSIYNKDGDVFKEKAEKYSSLKFKNRELAMNYLKLDYNKDTVQEVTEAQEFRSLTLRR